MAYRNGNYSAFYVDEPFNQNNLGANQKADFLFYNLLRAWKGADSTFPFIDSHDKTYNVRDGSDWEKTLKPRLHERLSNSKNIILFLSSTTKNSTPLREELDYGINTKCLPVIVIYPEYSEKSDIVNKSGIKLEIKSLWDKLPIFRDSMSSVPTLHVPMKKAIIKSALSDTDFIVNTEAKAVAYYYPI